MDDHAAAYRGIRERIAELTDGIGADAAQASAPATPDWRVQDVVAHVTGVNADVLAGNIEGAGTDPWTAAQVDARRERELQAIVREWLEIGPALDEIIPVIPDAPRGQLVFDAVSHEHDIRGALGAGGGRDDDALAIGFAWAADRVGERRDAAGLGALCLRTEQGDRIAGTAEVSLTVAADRFELLRAMTGRRSAEQVRAFGWSGVPAIEHLCLFSPRPTDLVE